MPNSAPAASSPAVRRVMQGNRGRDTKPEQSLRSAVFALGMRYRVDCAPVRGLRRRADLVFTRARVAVFVDGCFWHGCPEHFHVPSTNSEYWTAKIERNRQRDRDTDERLSGTGWTVVRIWEHDSPGEAALRVQRAVLDAR